MPVLAIDGFVDRRSGAWAELDAICARVESGNLLDPATVLRLSRLYRESVADLALARRRFAGAPLVSRLEELVSTAREVVYDAPRKPSPLPALEFAARGWWRLVAASTRWTAAAAGLLALLMLFAAAWADADPVAAGRTLPIQFRRIPIVPHGSIAQAYGLPRGVTGIDASWTALAALVLALVATAGGLLAGIGTLAALLACALALGVPLGLAVHDGDTGRWLTLLLANGLLLLLMVCIAAGQGLRLGAAVVGLSPGSSRARDVSAAGQRAALVLTGVTVVAAVGGVVQLVAKSGGAKAGAPIGVLAVLVLVTGILLLGREK